MVKFIIVSHQRSGSAFFTTLLNSSPGIHCLRECFLLKEMSPAPEYTFVHFLTRYLPPNIHDIFQLTPAEQNSLFKQHIESYLENIFAERPGIEGIGFKFMYDQIKRFPMALRWMEKNEVYVIHLIRKNTLKTILSWLTRMERGFPHSTAPVSQVKVKVDCKTLKDELHFTGDCIEKNRKDFSSQPHYLEVFYEDLVQFQERELLRIGSFLGIGYLGQLKSDLVKLNSDSIKDIVKNYDELEFTLKDTPFYPLLQDDILISRESSGKKMSESLNDLSVKQRELLTRRLRKKRR